MFVATKFDALERMRDQAIFLVKKAKEVRLLCDEGTEVLKTLCRGKELSYQAPIARVAKLLIENDPKLVKTRGLERNSRDP